MPLYLNFKNIVLEKGLLAKYNHYFDVFQTKAQPNFVMKIIKKVYYFPLCLPSFYLSLSIYIHMCVYIYRRRQWHPTPVLLPGKSHGRRSLEGCSSWGRWGSDTTEQLHFHFSLFTFMHWSRKWQPTPAFLPGESQGQGSLVGCHLWGHTESDTTEVT